MSPDTKWVLLVEDDDDIRQMLKDSICQESENQSVTVVEARNGVEALNQTAQRQFHCVVTDLKMPIVSGDELVIAMQSQALNSNTPTLVVSAHAEAEFREFCDRFAHIRVISKPFEPARVARAVLHELQLGRLDDRLAIHVLSPFMQTALGFLKTSLALDSTAETPEVKRSGSSLQGSMHCTITLTTGISRGNFTFSFDDKLLEWARERFLKNRPSNAPSIRHDHVIIHLVESFFMGTEPQIRALMGGVPRLGGLKIIDNWQREECDDLTQTTGIVAALTTDQGRVFFCALSRAKTRT